MTNQDVDLAIRIVALANSELDSIRSAVISKDFAFAKIQYARLQVDLDVLYNLIKKEE